MGLFGEGTGAVVWERLVSKKGPNNLLRAKVFGGWLVYVENIEIAKDLSFGITFIPDPEHQWDGTSR